MMKPENRLQLMNYFGAIQKNTHRSWCGINEENKSIYLSVWTDYRNKLGKRERDYYVIQEPHWGVEARGSFSRAARKDHDEKLALAFTEGYAVYGYFVVAKDKNAIPRKIERTITSFVFSLELEKLESSAVIGYPLQRIEIK